MPPARTYDNRWLIFVALVPATWALSCGQSHAPRQTASLRDSAGITIVENGLPAPSPLERWRLSETPPTEIGTLDGDPNHQFSEIASAFRLSDGRIVVADRGSREIRFFAADGTHLETVGGRGQGPGEFQRLHSLDRLPGDTLVASDWPVGALTWFASDGTYLFNSRIGPYRPGLIGRMLADGSLLVDVYQRASYGNELEWWAVYGEGDRFRPSGVIVRHGAGSEQVDTLGPITGEEWFRVGKWRQGLVIHALPFALTTGVAWSSERLYVADTGRPEIAVHRFDGALERLIRWQQKATPVTERDRGEFRQLVLGTLRQPSRRPDYERWLSQVPYPSAKPALRSLATDASGRVWVETWREGGAKQTPWLVFSAEGTLTAWVDVPSDLSLLDIGTDYVLARWKTELDVEYVRLYRLIT